VKGDLRIPRTIKLLRECWEKAESTVQNAANKFYDEEQVSFLLYRELQVLFDEQNSTRSFERRFGDDVKAAFPSVGIETIAKGLIARVTYHRRSVETRTGADPGFVVVRPNVQLRNSSLVATIYGRGLLVQAKRQREGGSLGGFTKAQKAILPDRLQYCAFLVYMYAAEDHETLAPFAWILGAGHKLSTIESILKRLKGIYPRTVEEIEAAVARKVYSSGAIIEALGDGKCGTGDQHVIADQICPGGTPTITIEIKWRDGRTPPPQPVRQHHPVHQQVVRLHT
jgi:hypothetical protein